MFAIINDLLNIFPYKSLCTLCSFPPRKKFRRGIHGSNGMNQFQVSSLVKTSCLICLPYVIKILSHYLPSFVTYGDLGGHFIFQNMYICQFIFVYSFFFKVFLRIYIHLYFFRNLINTSFLQLTL